MRTFGQRVLVWGKGLETWTCPASSWKGAHKLKKGEPGDRDTWGQRWRRTEFKCGPRPAASASLGSLLKMQTWRLHPRPNESANLRAGSQKSVLPSSPDDSDSHCSLRSQDLGHHLSLQDFLFFNLSGIRGDLNVWWFNLKPYLISVKMWLSGWMYSIYIHFPRPQGRMVERCLCRVRLLSMASLGLSSASLDSGWS